MVQLMSILVLIWMVFMIISDIFHGRIALNLMFLLLLLYFVSESKLELMYISLIVNIKSSLFHLHDFSAIQAMSWDKSDCLQSREHSFTFKYSNQALAEWYSVLHGNSPSVRESLNILRTKRKLKNNNNNNNDSRSNYSDNNNDNNNIINNGNSNINSDYNYNNYSNSNKSFDNDNDKLKR